MRLRQKEQFDVIVAGSGIAGIRAAVKAAEEGCSVLLLSAGTIFSGSSFYPGTWGLGLIGPENSADEEDLVQTILQVGCGMAEEKLVRSFVAGITPAIDEIRQMGVRLKESEQHTQRDFIPCFDYKHRSWHGLLFDSVRQVFSERLTALSVRQQPNSELLELTRRDGKITGAIIAQKETGIQWIGCKAVVLATGGYGGLFQRRLTTDDVSGMGQWIALQNGCRLVNMEFLQMMPGFISPCSHTIFNEKAFRFSDLYAPDGTNLLKYLANDRELLDGRSTHGPFTSRLPTREVDLALAATQTAMVRYRPEIQEGMPEFIQTYFDWLWEQKGLTIADSVEIATFAHAANGGVEIDETASTNVLGLFACGEVTGGMHGADRLGGLSTANGLVFGGRAGAAAASYAKSHQFISVSTHLFDGWEIPKKEWIRKGLRETMTSVGMVVREEGQLHQGIRILQSLMDRCGKKITADPMAIADSRKLWGQLQLATGILQAELLRRESRGAHYRKDYPGENAQMNRRIEICWQNQTLQVDFESPKKG